MSDDETFRLLFRIISLTIYLKIRLMGNAFVNINNFVIYTKLYELYIFQNC